MLFICRRSQRDETPNTTEIVQQDAWHMAKHEDDLKDAMSYDRSTVSKCLLRSFRIKLAVAVRRPGKLLPSSDR